MRTMWSKTILTLLTVLAVSAWAADEAPGAFFPIQISPSPLWGTTTDKYVVEGRGGVNIKLATRAVNYGYRTPLNRMIVYNVTTGRKVFDGAATVDVVQLPGAGGDRVRVRVYASKDFGPPMAAGFYVVYWGVKMDYRLWDATNMVWGPYSTLAGGMGFGAFYVSPPPSPPKQANEEAAPGDEEGSGGDDDGESGEEEEASDPYPNLDDEAYFIDVPVTLIEGTEQDPWDTTIPPPEPPEETPPPMMPPEPPADMPPPPMMPQPPPGEWQF